MKIIDRFFSAFFIGLWFLFIPIIFIVLFLQGLCLIIWDYFIYDISELYNIFKKHNKAIIKIWNEEVLKK